MSEPIDSLMSGFPPADMIRSKPARGVFPGTRAGHLIICVSSCRQQRFRVIKSGAIDQRAAGFNWPCFF